MFQITITGDGDLLGIRTVDTASEMEEAVTQLHIEFPGARTDVEEVHIVRHPRIWPHYIDHPDN